MLTSLRGGHRLTGTGQELTTETVDCDSPTPDCRLTTRSHPRRSFHMLARGCAVAVDSRPSPHAAAGYAADRVGAQDEPPPAPFGTIEYAPLPAGIGGEAARRSVQPVCAPGVSTALGELLVDAIVADTDTETKGLRWRAIAAGLERDAAAKVPSPRHGQNVDEPARGARQDGRLRLACNLDVGDVERGARRSRLGVAEVAHEVHDPNW